MNDSDRNRLIRSVELSGVFWLALGLFFVLVPFGKNPEIRREFTSVSITLTAPSVAPLSAAPSLSSSSSGSEPVASREKTDGKKPASGRESGASAAARKPAAGQKTAQAARTSGLGIPDFAKSPASSKQTDSGSDSLDFSSSGDTVTPLAVQKTKTATAEFEGTAAAVQKSAPAGAAVSSRSGSSGSGAGAASAETSRSLETIAGSARSGTGSSSGAGGSGGGIASGGTASGNSGGNGGGTGSSAGASSIGGISFDGKARRLLYPAKPVVTLPENLSRLVDSDRSVTIQFTVRADGTVPSGLVSFTPSAILPADIRDWLRNEFSRWRFEPSLQDGQARFLYSIRVQ